MNTAVNHRRAARIGITPILLATSVSAQTVGSSEALREVLKKELGPISLSIKDQAKAVAADLARTVLSELASSMNVTAPRRKLARSDGVSDEKDAS